jgi:hypothetical protein
VSAHRWFKIRLMQEALTSLITSLPSTDMKAKMKRNTVNAELPAFFSLLMYLLPQGTM